MTIGQMTHLFSRIGRPRRVASKNSPLKTGGLKAAETVVEDIRGYNWR